MEKDLKTIVKEILIDFTKKHNEYSGKIMEVFNHVDESIKILESLPIEMQNEIKQKLFLAFITFQNKNL